MDPSVAIEPNTIPFSDQILDGLFDLYGTLDTDGRVVDLSGRVFNTTATDPGLLAGQRFAETVYWQSSPTTAGIVANEIALAADGVRRNVMLDFRIRYDQKVPIELAIIPINTERGTRELFVAGRLIAGDHGKVTSGHKDSDELLSAAANAEMGLWYWDFVGQQIYSTPQCNELLGLPAYDTLTFEKLLDAVHPDDRTFVKDFLDNSRLKGSKYEEEFRIIYPTGEVEWICVEGKTILGEGGHPVKMMGVVRKVTEQKLAAEELSKVHDREKKARDEAIEANRAKDFFLAFVSHELRAPLNAILGWSKILLTKEVDEKTHRNALETIERSARVQAKLINDLVDSARVASGKLRLEYRPTNLYDLVLGSCQGMEPAAVSKGIKLEFTADRNDVVVFGDANRLQQVFGNLISNAIKFTSEGGHVQVTMKAGATSVQVSIVDNGRGIGPESLPFIFRQFSQGEADNRNSSGLGLGLSIAKVLAERHGGSIEVESSGHGLGSNFTVTLPLSDPNMKVEQVETVEKLKERKPLEGLKILIVEDDPDSREVLMLYLEQSGAKVTGATNAKTAFTLLGELKGQLPDVIVSDLAMPEEDGYSLISRIRKLPMENGGEIPAIALSAFASEESRQKAFEAGFTRYSTKPFEPDLLIRDIKDVVQQTNVSESDQT